MSVEFFPKQDKKDKVPIYWRIRSWILVLAFVAFIIKYLLDKFI